MSTPSRGFRSGSLGATEREMVAGLSPRQQRRLVRRHVRRCLAVRRSGLPAAMVTLTARLATGPTVSLSAKVAELVRITLDDLSP